MYYSMVRYLLEWTLLITLGYEGQPILVQFWNISVSGMARITLAIQLSRKTTLQHTFTNYATYNCDPDKSQWGDFSDHSATDIHSILIGMWCHITASVVTDISKITTHSSSESISPKRAISSPWKWRLYDPLSSQHLGPQHLRLQCQNTLTVKNKALQSFRVPGPTHPTTQHCTSHDRNLHPTQSVTWNLHTAQCVPTTSTANILSINCEGIYWTQFCFETHVMPFLNRQQKFWLP